MPAESFSLSGDGTKGRKSLRCVWRLLWAFSYCGHSELKQWLDQLWVRESLSSTDRKRTHSATKGKNILGQNICEKGTKCVGGWGEGEVSWTGWKTGHFESHLEAGERSWRWPKLAEELGSLRRG